MCANSAQYIVRYRVQTRELLFRASEWPDVLVLQMFLFSTALFQNFRMHIFGDQKRLPNTGYVRMT